MKGSANYNGTVVVIPTRNRAEIAMNAIRSVLNQPVNDVQVLVSDNSTSEPDRAALSSFCERLADSRVQYLTTPQPFSMTDNWEWAMQQALSRYEEVSHFAYLTDRMMFRPGALKSVLDFAALYPDKIISYNHDRIDDHSKPIRIDQYPGTGKLLEVKTLRLSGFYSQGIFHPCLPRMLNCVAPRSSIERVQARFGNVFASIAPDFHFCCRCFETEESILFYDKSPIFHYALNRSNGSSAVRGEMSPDNLDFIANLPVDNSVRNYATPIPELITAANAAFNEYLIVKQETRSPRFFEVDKATYLRCLAIELEVVEDPEMKRHMHSVLMAHGLGSVALPRERSLSIIVRKLFSPRAVGTKLRSLLIAAIANPFTKPAWLFLARHFSVKPPDDHRFEFDSLEEAISFINEYGRRNSQAGSRHVALLQSRELTGIPQ